MSFNPVRMSKIRVIGLKSREKQVIESLYNFGGSHLKKVETSFLEKGKPLNESSEVVSELIRLQGILNFLKPQKVKVKELNLSLNQLLKEAKKIRLDESLSKLKDKKDSFEKEKSYLLERKELISLFHGFDFKFSLLSNPLIEVFSGSIQLNLVNALRERISKVTSSFDLTYNVLKDKAIVLIVVDKKDSLKVKKELDSSAFKSIPIPRFDGTPKQELNSINSRIRFIDKELSLIDKSIEKVSKQNYAEISYLVELLKIEKDKLNASLNFGETSDLFVLECYVPEKNLGELKSILGSFKSKIVVKDYSLEELEEHHEVPPTMLSTPSFFSHYAYLTKLFNLPQSIELDPTLIFAFMFPIFYGMMLGDVGYGLISIVLALLLIKISDPKGMLKPIATIWLFGSIPAIIFGVIYDEYFGFPHHKILEMIGFHGVELYVGLERLHNIELLLPIIILLGVFSMVLGFFLGFLNELREKNYLHALAKIAWMTLIVSGATLLAALLFNALPSVLIIPSGVLFFLSIIPIFAAEGIIGLIEIPSVAGNILSFARILAVGLASVVVAIILNDLAFPSLDKGLMVLIMLPIFIFGHVFNTFLGMFEALIQGGRLNYVEFYTKFFKGGGKEFIPFKAKRKFTKTGGN